MDYYSWSDFELDESSDAIPDKYILTIWESAGAFQDELAVIVHRTCNGKYPLDGELANQKRSNAIDMVRMLNSARDMHL